jgi:hypothetical protein
MPVPNSSDRDSITRWRHRAAECRASAVHMTDDTLRDSLIATAKSYEAMAAHAQARLKQKRDAEDETPPG